MDTEHSAAAPPRHPRLAAALVWIGLVGAFGGGTAEVVRDELMGNGIDWGSLNACLTFGILLAAYGECWSHAPSPGPASIPRTATDRGDRQRSLADKG
jgi:hypothetical protein